MLLLKVLLAQVVLISYTECSNVLIIFNIPSKSLHLAGVTMSKILAEKGHNVTLVSGFLLDDKIANFHHIYLKEVAENSKRTYANFFDYVMDPYTTLFILEQHGIINCDTTLADAAFKNFLDSRPTVDLLIIDSYMSNCLLYLPEYFNAPVIIYASFDAGYPVNLLTGNPAPPSYVASAFLQYSSNMSFFQRMNNVFFSLVTEILHYVYTQPKHDAVIKKHFPGAPDIDQYFHKASVVLSNSDVSITDAVPITPGIVTIGGFHIEQPKPLPKDLETLISNAKYGVILFSLGSNVRSSQMPKERVEAILDIFSRLKETVVWKWEDEDIPGKPNNVILKKWLPQSDILAHKNVKLFITHGGQHGILETVYHGVPCLALSIFLDQGSNSFRASNIGFGEWVPYTEFTPEKFENALNKVLNDPKYTQVVKERSKILRDKPISPKESLTYWVEYVIRHKGADHLKIGALKLNWYQYLLIDILLFICFCLFTVLYIFKILIKLIASPNKSNECIKKKKE